LTAAAALPLRAAGDDTDAAPRWLPWLAAAALLWGAAVAVRMALLRTGFSEDEFFQLSFVNEPLPTFFTQFVRLDQHPFFHFLQLKLWGLVSHADGWMAANSMLA
jgi:hypothetical protein